MSRFCWMCHYLDAKNQAGVYEMDFRDHPQATLVTLKRVFFLRPSNYSLKKQYRLDLKILNIFEEIMSY